MQLQKSRKECDVKLYALLLTSIFAIAGCSSSNDNVPSDNDETVADEGTITDEGTTTDEDAFDADETISAALSVVNTEHLKRAMDLAPIPTPDDSFTLVDPDFVDGVRTWECPVSGTVDVAAGSNGGREYHDCVTDVGHFNGKYRIASSSAGNLVVLVNFDQFSVVHANSLLTIERGDLFYSESADSIRSRQWIWTDVVWSSVTMNESMDVEITTVKLEKTGNDEYRAEFDATLIIDETSSTIITKIPLKSEVGDNYYTSGQFEISSENEFSALVDADSGNPDSALITVAIDASTESHIRDWSNTLYIDCLSEDFTQRPAIDCNSD